MAGSRTTFTSGAGTAERARQLGTDIAAAARREVADALSGALAHADRGACARR